MQCPNCNDSELVKLEESHKEYLEIKKEEEKIESVGLRSEAFVCEKCGYINIVVKKEEE